MNRSANLVALLVGWAACLWGAANEHPFLGPLVVGMLLAAQSFTMIDPRRTVGLTAVVAILGTGIDSTLLARGWYVATQPQRGDWLCPLWITALWVGLGTALHGCLAGLAGRYALSAMVGAMAAPLVYVVAHCVGAIKILVAPAWALPTLAVMGAATLPLVLWISRLGIYRPRSMNNAYGDG